ncbi:hypothetical protein P7C70_g8750, partial [Phenoliferia sp. Uapishka_3]
ILDPPVHTLESYRLLIEEDEDDEVLLAGRRALPGSFLQIQKCADCRRWGNVTNGLFSPLGWKKYGDCIRCSRHEATRLKAAELGNLGDERTDPGMWEAHVDQCLHNEVALLQLGLLVDHNKFLSHDIAAKIVERERVAGRQTWIKSLKERIHATGSIPTYGNLEIADPLEQPACLNPGRHQPAPYDPDHGTYLFDGNDTAFDAMNPALLNPPHIYDVWSSQGDLATNQFRQLNLERARDRHFWSTEERLRHDVNGVREPNLSGRPRDHHHRLANEPSPDGLREYPAWRQWSIDDMHVTYSPEVQSALRIAMARERVEEMERQEGPDL